MAGVVHEGPMAFEKEETVEQASLGDQRPTQTAFVSTSPVPEERPQAVGETTFLAHAPGFSVIETGEIERFIIILAHTQCNDFLLLSFLEERHLVPHHFQALVRSSDVTRRQQRTRSRPKDLYG